MMNAVKSATDLLDDRTYHIEFNGHLTNHVKHAVVALAGLGAEPERIQSYYDQYAELTPYGYGLESPVASQYVIDESNWKALLGKRTSFSAYCEFFDERERRLGTEELLARYVPELLPGWVGAFTHATIHLGWALDADSRWMMIEGLAYMAFAYDSCHPERSRPGRSSGATVVESLLLIAAAWEAGRGLEDWVEAVIADTESPAVKAMHPELVRSGLQYRIGRLLAEGHPLIDATPAWIDGQDVCISWEQLRYVVALVYLAQPGDFIYLHAITSLHAMEQIAERLAEEDRHAAVRCFWMGMLCILFAQGRFPGTQALETLHRTYRDAVDAADGSAGESWDEIVVRAVQEDEEHNPKMVYVLRRWWTESERRTIYREAARHFTTTPELPKSFEQPPTT